MDNKIGKLLSAINNRIDSTSTNCFAQAEDVKTTTHINETPSFMTIKDPSKLFKQTSPKGKEVRDPFS